MNPITRREVFLAAAGGQQVETPEPITREEMYLKQIAEGGGGSSLPDNPAEDGTYVLQNTVSGGTDTLSWASGGSSGGGVLVVHSEYEEWEESGTWKWKETLDKTATELASADFVVLDYRPNPIEAGLWRISYLCRVNVPSEYELNPKWGFVFTGTYKDGDDIKVDWYEFKSSSVDGYPFAEGELD